MYTKHKGMHHLNCMYIHTMCSYVCMHILYIAYWCIFTIQKTSAIESMPKESDQTASRKVDEQAKLLDSLQSKLKDLEDQNSDLQKKLQNVCTYM